MTDLTVIARLREAACALEQKIAVVASMTGKGVVECSEPSLHAENRFLRAENEILRGKLRESDDLMTLVHRQSEMLKLQSQALRRFET
jgi:hypothetical protein